MKCKRLSGAALAVVIAGLLVSCAQKEPEISTARPADAPVAMNGLTAKHLVEVIGREGLPARNSYDATSVMCKQVQCLEAVDTDTFAVLKFSATGNAQKYAGSVANSYQVEDIVLVFMPTVSADARKLYESAVAKALA